MTKQAKNISKPKQTKKLSKPQKGAPVSPRAEDVPVDPDENMKWMTSGRLVLAVFAVIAALVVRGWMSARGTGS
jgi:hypothetical protein